MKKPPIRTGDGTLLRGEVSLRKNASNSASAGWGPQLGQNAGHIPGTPLPSINKNKQSSGNLPSGRHTSPNIAAAAGLKTTAGPSLQSGTAPGQRDTAPADTTFTFRGNGSGQFTESLSAAPGGRKGAGGSVGALGSMLSANAGQVLRQGSVSLMERLENDQDTRSGAPTAVPAEPEAVEREQQVDAQPWLEELSQAGRRDEGWLKTARRLVDMYESSRTEEHSSHYNILYANTDTLAPALYNSLPRPTVMRRFRDADPVGRVVSQAVQRALAYWIDDNLSDQASFDDMMRQAVLEAAVPGRGVTWFAFTADFDQVYGESDSPEHEAAEPPAWEKVENERIVIEHIPYDRFRHGYGRKWCEVPWVARMTPMNREELTKNFGDVGAEVPVTKVEGKEASEFTGDAQAPKEAVATVWEIWDRDTRSVYFVAEGFPTTLRVLDDPLELPTFFPCPRPMTFVPKMKNLVPTPLYQQYAEQAKELNRISVRINKIVEALRVRGFYDTTVPGLDKVLKAGDNELLPAENVAGLIAQGLKLTDSIHLLPIEKLITVLQQLYVQREQTKQVIYELTGIADIMRGSSAASETLGAQKIKQSWGTLRLKRMQNEVARYTRDCLRIMSGILKHFSEDSLKAMTGLPYPTGAEKAEMQMQLQMAQQAGMQLPPEATAALQAPSWSDILQIIKDDIARSFRIDIETNSTVDAEATQDKEEVVEVMNAIGQFLNGVAPMVQEGLLPFDAAKEILLSIVRRFRFGTDVEDKLQKMQAPQPKSDPAVEKVKAQMEIDKQSAALDMQAKQMELQLRQREMQMELEFKEREHQIKLAELVAKQEAAALAHRQKMTSMAMQAAMPQKSGVAETQRN